MAALLPSMNLVLLAQLPVCGLHIVLFGAIAATPRVTLLVSCTCHLAHHSGYVSCFVVVLQA
jgi:hypothetical protein